MTYFYCEWMWMAYAVCIMVVEWDIYYYIKSVRSKSLKKEMASKIPEDGIEPFTTSQHNPEEAEGNYYRPKNHIL